MEPKETPQLLSRLNEIVERSRRQYEKAASSRPQLQESRPKDIRPKDIRPSQTHNAADKERGGASFKRKVASGR